jgi:hypothetical protein
MYHAVLGEFDAAAEWYEKSLDNRDALAVGLLRSKVLAPLMSGPRWPQLRKKLNLPA